MIPTSSVEPSDTKSTDPATPAAVIGLKSQQAERHLAEYDENAVREQQVSPFHMLFGYFWGPIPWMIEVAVVLSGAAQRWEDLTIIASLLLINAGVRFWEEHKADYAIEALKQRLAPVARVMRGGAGRHLPTQFLVQGDVVFLKIVNIVPADADFVGSDYLSVDQSALTGESLPIDKKPVRPRIPGPLCARGRCVQLSSPPA